MPRELAATARREASVDAVLAVADVVGGARLAEVSHGDAGVVESKSSCSKRPPCVTPCPQAGFAQSRDTFGPWAGLAGARASTEVSQSGAHDDTAAPSTSMSTVPMDSTDSSPSW